MPVIYGGNSIRPAPKVRLSRSNNESSDGRKLGTTIQATLTGTITATKTNDTETAIAIESRLSTILQKQEALREVFATDGQLLEIQGYDGSAPIKFNALVKSIDFDEGLWVDVSNYTVVLEGYYFAGEEWSGDPYIESASENWSFEEAEGPHTYRAVHTLNAKGKTVYDADGNLSTPAWQRAKDFVVNQLGLGWNTTETPWSTTAGSTLAADSSVALDASTPYNRIISETLDEFEGTYGVTETFFVSANPYWEEYTVSVRRVTDERFFGTAASIQGTIHGLYVNLHDIETKLVNAKARWVALQPMLLSRVQAYVPSGVTLNSHPVTATSDMNYNEGTVTYAYEFNDRTITNDTLETYNVSMQTSSEDNRTTVTIEGSIHGQQYQDENFSLDIRYNRALAQWNIVKLLLFSRCVNETAIADLRAFPVSASMTPNKDDGSIQYSFSFDNRIPETVRDEFTVSTRFSREDGRTYVTIEGTITGYRSASATNPFVANSAFERYDNALSYWNSIESNLLGLAATYVDTSLVNPTPYSKQVNHIPRGGQLTYTYEYNSIPAPCYNGSLSEIITITDEAATKVIAVVPVLGRAAGPVLQDTGTVKEKRRSVTIEIVMPVSGTISTCSASSNPAPVVDITSYAPSGSLVYLEQDQSSWSPTSGHFSRQASWIYQ